MKILVTGGIGGVGHPLTTRLLSHGHQVRIADRRVDQPIEGAELIQCDITDYEAFRKLVHGMDAIIHLAAIPYPGGAEGHEIFRINCTSTYNVFEAAAKEGIRRVVCASSINALGYNFGIKYFPIRYFPLDEDHPTYTTDPYSFSKQTTESIADYYWRREGISSVCFRLPWVVPTKFEVDFAPMGKQYRANYQAAVKDLLALPAAERMAEITHMHQAWDEMRAARVNEKLWVEGQEEEGWPEDRMTRLLFGYTDFWTIITGQDSAQAFEKAVTADYEGSQALYVCESKNSIGIESETLAGLLYPETTRRTRPLVGDESLVSIDRARELIGFEPENLTLKLLGQA